MNDKKITNPLTIVGIFSGVAEIAGTTVLAFLSPELQALFIWYVMLFPVLLVLLFFITWNFNSEVLYSPGDFQDEKNFLVYHANKTSFDSSVKEDIDKAKDELEQISRSLKSELRDKIDNTLNETKLMPQNEETISNDESYKPTGESSAVGNVDLSGIDDFIEEKIASIIKQLDETKENTSKYFDRYSDDPSADFQRIAMDALANGNVLSLKELSMATMIPQKALVRVLLALQRKGIVACEGYGRMVKYRMK